MRAVAAAVLHADRPGQQQSAALFASGYLFLFFLFLFSFSFLPFFLSFFLRASLRQVLPPPHGAVTLLRHATATPSALWPIPIRGAAAWLYGRAPAPRPDCRSALPCPSAGGGRQERGGWNDRGGTHFSLPPLSSFFHFPPSSRSEPRPICRSRFPFFFIPFPLRRFSTAFD